MSLLEVDFDIEDDEEELLVALKSWFDDGACDVVGD